MLWLGLLVLLIIAESVADIFAKEYSLQDKSIFLVGAFILYFVATGFWLWSIKSGSGLARGVIIFSLASTLVAIIIGWGFYHENLSMRQVAGMLIGVLALVLILWE